MNEYRLWGYIGEIRCQFELFKFGVDNLNLIARHGIEDHGNIRTLASIQIILTSAAMISKMLWPGNKKAKAQNRATVLRSQLGIPEASILQSRKVRDGLEHFDERLDDYLTEGIAIVHRNVVPRRRDILNQFVPRGMPVRYFINYDADALVVSVMEEQIALQELASAVDEIVEKVDDWLKNHPEPSSGQVLT